MLPMTELTLSPGVTLRDVHTKKFKTSVTAVTFVEPLTAEHAALHALLPKVLHRGTQTHPDMQAPVCCAGRTVRWFHPAHPPQEGGGAVHRLLGQLFG